MPDERKTPDLLVFPKFFQSLSVEQLAERMLSLGFDGVDVILREGYWCADGDYRRTLPAFVKELRARGLKAYTATTNWTLKDADGIEEAYRVFAECGVTMFRFWMFEYRGHQSFAQCVDACRRALGRLEALGRKFPVKALIQTHGGTMSWSPEAAYLLIHDLDPKAIGVHYDPANMRQQEGWTSCEKAIDILGPHLAYVGVKNGGWFLAPDPKRDQRLRWQAQWTRLELGLVDWPAVTAELRKAGFAGPYCMHNFYSSTLEGLTEETRADVQYFRRLI